MMISVAVVIFCRIMEEHDLLFFIFVSVSDIVEIFLLR